MNSNNNVGDHDASSMMLSEIRSGIGRVNSNKTNNINNLTTTNQSSAINKAE